MLARLEKLVCFAERSQLSRFETTIAIEEACTVFCNLKFCKILVRKYNLVLNVNLKGRGRVGGGFHKTGHHHWSMVWQQVTFVILSGHYKALGTS